MLQRNAGFKIYTELVEGAGPPVLNGFWTRITILRSKLRCSLFSLYLCVQYFVSGQKDICPAAGQFSLDSKAVRKLFDKTDTKSGPVTQW